MTARMDAGCRRVRSTRYAALCLALGISAGFSAGLSGPARAQGAAALHEARLGLARYELASGATSALEALAQLTALLRSGELSAVERDEARYLRAAAASDLLILARVRDEPTLEPALEAALGLAKGAVPAHLDAELAACSQPHYRVLSARVRAALALAGQARPWAWAQLSAMHGSQRDLLLLHQITAVSATAADPTSALSAYAADPCVDGAPCPAPYAAFDAPGRRAVAGLAEAALALSRLHAASAAGDPLAATAVIELATFGIALTAIELRPGLRSEHGAAWLNAAGQPIEPSPELLLRIGEYGARYVLAPRVRLGATAALELFDASEQGIAGSGEVPFRTSPRPFVAPVAELVDFLRQVLAADAARSVAIIVDPGEPAYGLGRTLASLRRAGWEHAVLIGGAAGADGESAHPVRITLADPAVAVRAELALRVRLGGYSLRARSHTAVLDIPRIRGRNGFRFDTETLAAELAGRTYEISQLSFMPQVASDQVTTAVVELGKSSNSLELLLP